MGHGASILLPQLLPLLKPLINKLRRTIIRPVMPKQYDIKEQGIPQSKAEQNGLFLYPLPYGTFLVKQGDRKQQEQRYYGDNRFDHVQAERKDPAPKQVAHIPYADRTGKRQYG